MIVIFDIAYGYKPEKVKARYVRAPGRYLNQYCQVELGYLGESDETLYEIRSLFCDAEDLPPDIKAKADKEAGTDYPYVRWPLER